MSSTRKFYAINAVRDWEARFAPLITEQLRVRRRGKAGRSWHVDETYIKVGAKWCHLYRAIDRDGNLVDSMLSEHRDMEAAKRFFARAKLVAGHAPEKVITEGHDVYPRAIRKVPGRKVVHRTSSLAFIKFPYYRLEQDHRGIKQRYYSRKVYEGQGFDSFQSASGFCSAYDEQREYFRYRTRPKEVIPLSEQRQMQIFKRKFDALQGLLMTA